MSSREFSRQSFRINLQVPYEQKDSAKVRGARWDGKKKTWYAIIGPNTSIITFAEWLKPKDQEMLVEWLKENGDKKKVIETVEKFHLSTFDNIKAFDK